MLDTMPQKQPVGSKLDKYYTRSEIAEGCLDALYEKLGGMGGLPDKGLGELNSFRDVVRSGMHPAAKFFFVEPSAGAGAFYDLLPDTRRLGMDICPTWSRTDILKQDFLEWEPAGLPKPNQTVVIGNPPFGRRGSSAVDFFKKSASFADTVAFVVPVSFRKFSIQRQLPQSFKLVGWKELPQDAFELPDGSNYRVNAEFQIWSKLAGFKTDFRLHARPPITHSDFELRQYNNTTAALKVFDLEFDFAVPCQGYQDYSRRETKSADCEKHKQWMLFKAQSRKVLERLLAIDFEKMAFKVATVTPGFRKNDVVAEYEKTMS